MMKKALTIITLVFIVSIIWFDRRPYWTPQPTPTPVMVKASPTVKPKSTPRPATPKPQPVEPYVGMYVSKETAKSWEWQGTDSTTVKNRDGSKVRTIKYRYDTVERSYTIWVSEEYSDIVKLNYSDKGKSTNSTSKRKSVVPTPDVSGYSHAEDFYDWYRDDFDDYEDAEDWYEEHGGW